jgi:hypothetical protein
MRLFREIALSCTVLLSAGCGLKLGGPVNGNSGSPKASAVQVYNCTDSYTFDVLRKKVGTNSWSGVGNLGSTSDESTCPDDSDVPITVQLPSAGTYSIRLHYKDVNAECELLEDQTDECYDTYKSFEYESGGDVLIWEFTNN